MTLTDDMHDRIIAAMETAWEAVAHDCDQRDGEPTSLDEGIEIVLGAVAAHGGDPDAVKALEALDLRHQTHMAATALRPYCVKADYPEYL